MAPRGLIAGGVALAAFLALGACGQTASGPGVEQVQGDAETPAEALFDVDAAATTHWKEQLSIRFGRAAETAAVEAALVAEGFECGPDPTKPQERACLRVRPDNGCEQNEIVRTQPWVIDTAQIIRACRQTR